jgi:isoleucyl-tRNA synthetase
LHGFTPPTDMLAALQTAELTELDRWALVRTESARVAVTEYMDAADMMRSGRALEELVEDLSTWYLRRSRKRTDTAFFTTLHSCLRTVSMLAAPLAPFLTEYLWQGLKLQSDPPSVHLADWPKIAWQDVQSEAVIRDMAAARQYVELGLRARAEHKMKIRQPLARVVLGGDAAVGLAGNYLTIIADELNVIEVLTSGDIDGYAFAEDLGYSVALDTAMTPALEQAGFVREFTRQIQNMRKTMGLQPGQEVHLVLGPDWHATMAPLFEVYPNILTDCFLKVGETTWERLGSEEIIVNGQTIPVSLVA